ncbi:hypothetical protein [Geodermatophilus sp. URMC 65]
MSSEVGYGRLPLDLLDELVCEPNEAHVLYVDEIERGEILGYRVPIPNISRSLDVRLTLAYASSVEPSQPTEYTNASLELAFRPHHLMYRLRPPVGSSRGSVVLNIASPEAQELLDQGWDIGQEPVTASLSGAKVSPEHELRNAGKWETLRHSRLSLKAGEASEPRLEVTYVARRGGALDNAPTKVPFAILLTLIGDAADFDVYDDVRVQYAALRPVQRVRGAVRVGAGPVPTWG